MSRRQSNNDAHELESSVIAVVKQANSVGTIELSAENEYLKRQVEELTLQLTLLKQHNRSNKMPSREKHKKSPSPEAKRPVRWIQFGPPLEDAVTNDTVPSLQTPDGLHQRHMSAATTSMTMERPHIEKRSRLRKANHLNAKDKKDTKWNISAIDEELGSDCGTESIGDVIHEMAFGKMVCDRASWLVGLLVLQSMSSFIIAHNEKLLKRHIIIVQFLTMLVGAGGNAGNQATVRVIRGLAIGTVNTKTVHTFIQNEFLIGVCLSIILAIAGFLRALAFSVPIAETISITAALFMIVFISVAIGAMLPLGMKRIGIDPAHASTTIQVFMDILGVTITVYVSAGILDSPLGDWLGSSNYFQDSFRVIIEK